MTNSDEMTKAQTRAEHYNHDVEIARLRGCLRACRADAARGEMMISVRGLTGQMQGIRHRIDKTLLVRRAND